MRRGEWGRIVNVGSIMGERGSRGSIPYSVAKAGIANLTRCLACDLAPDDIVVNAVAPCFIDTRMALLPDGSGHEHEFRVVQGNLPQTRSHPAATRGHARGCRGCYLLSLFRG